MPRVIDAHRDCSKLTDPRAKIKGSNLFRADVSVMEIVIVTAAVLALIKLVRENAWGQHVWFAVPIVLLIAALAPTWLLERRLAEVGLTLRGWSCGLASLMLTSLLVFPGTLLLLWLLIRCGYPLPPAPQVESNQWAGWLVYQLLYVAMSEELFFRGYLLGQLLELGTRINHRWRLIFSTGCVIISAGAFALAHMILQGTIVSGLTFFPGLIFGSLFLKTRSLLAPILFHTLANMFYAIALVLLR